MRSLGANPKDEEIRAMIAEVDREGTGSIDFPGFCEMMARKMHVSDCEQELREAFRVFDDQNEGKISPDALRLIVNSLTEGALSSGEVDEIVDMACQREGCDGRVNYESFASLMMQGNWRGAAASAPVAAVARPASSTVLPT